MSLLELTAFHALLDHSLAMLTIPVRFVQLELINLKLVNFNVDLVQALLASLESPKYLEPAHQRNVKRDVQQESTSMNPLNFVRAVVMDNTNPKKVNSHANFADWAKQRRKRMPFPNWNAEMNVQAAKNLAQKVFAYLVREELTELRAFTLLVLAVPLKELLSLLVPLLLKIVHCPFVDQVWFSFA